MSLATRKAAYLNVNKKKQSRKKRIIILAVIALLPLVPATIIRASGFYPVSINSDAMQPTILQGDTLILKEKSYTPQNNDIVLVKIPLHTQPMICRIVAVEGQEIRMENSMVYVNGNQIMSKAANSERNLDEAYARRDNYSALRLPLDQFFCLNDNRFNLFDSRTFGAVEKKQIIAKVLFKRFFTKIP